MNEKDLRPNRDRPARKSLRSEVADIDRQILQLMLKRYNLLEKMRHKGRLDPAEEKFLRESWQSEAARISRDSELSGRFFSLMQSVRFLPRPTAPQAGDGESLPGAQRRDAFNLAPPRQPVSIALTAPLDSRATRAWLYLAACAGKAIKLAPSAQNDHIVDCVKALVQMGAAITREEDAVLARESQPLGAPDKVIHAGDSEFNFYLCLAHYLGRPSHAKFTGDVKLKLADFSALGSCLPGLGARLVHVVPHSSGLPARLECSGILPASFSFAPVLPAEFAQALLLAAPSYSQPFALDLGPHAQKDEILANALPLLEECGATFSLAGDCVNLEPTSLAIPKKPDVPADAAIAAVLLAFAEALGGQAVLAGHWPRAPRETALWDLLMFARLPWEKTASQIRAASASPISAFSLAQAPENLARRTDPGHAPILAALAACAALAGGSADLPDLFLNQPEVSGFLSAAGLEPTEGNKIVRSGAAPASQWTAPSPLWAMAFALAACARSQSAGFQLANPGIVTELWPSFWAIYNSLPAPRLKKEQPASAPVKRRRILTNVVAVPPEIREEDWD